MRKLYSTIKKRFFEWYTKIMMSNEEGYNSIITEIQKTHYPELSAIQVKLLLANQLIMVYTEGYAQALSDNKLLHKWGVRADEIHKGVRV